MPNKLFQFWQELKRRKVVRVITVYAAASFVILELVDIVSPSLRLPEWTMNLIIVLLCVGFIIAVILSWVYDVTPEGVEKTKPSKEVRKDEKTATPNSWRIATYVSVVIIIGLLAFNIIRGRSGAKIDESLEKSIAILPFHNFSGDPNKEYIGDGLTDEIINHLYKIESFDKVISLTSVLSYKDTDKNTTEIAEELKVNYILEGSCKRIGEQLRVTAQLIEPKNDMHIWQHDYDRPYKDIIAIPADIALQIADHLKAFLTDPEKQNVQKISTSNQEAYDKYLLGKHFYRKGPNKIDLTTAISLFKESIALDSDFALAYTYLASCYLNNYWYHYDLTKIPLIESKKAIDAAFRIDPDLPEAFIALAEYYYHGFLDYSNALDQLKTASEYMPDHPECKFLTAAIYRRMGEWEKAIVEFESAYQSDPGSVWIVIDMISTYYLFGKYQEALNYLEKEIMIAPDNSRFYGQEIELYLLRDGNTVNARKVIKDAALLNISKVALMNSLLFATPLMLDIYDENYQKALDFVSSTSWEGYITKNSYHPKSLFQAMIYNLMRLPEKASAYYDSARVQLETMILENPDDPRILNSLGIAYAGLGEKEKAIRFGKKAVELCSIDTDALKGLYRIEELAWVYVMVEEYDTALEQIEILLSNPGPYTAPLLKLDPKWKPLWDHPDFIRLTEKYAVK